jgi:uncharacterized protein (TIGR02271 family)
MNTKATETVVGVFKDDATARRVINQLVSDGFDRSDIHLSSEDTDTAGTSQTFTDADTTGTHREHGFMGWLHSLFGHDEGEDTRRYSGAVERGHPVVAVDSDASRIDRAVQVMNENGAVDVDVETDDTASYPSTAAGFSGSGSDYSSANDRRSSGEYGRETGQVGNASRAELNTGETIPVVEEELKVGKRVIQRGGVRVYSRVEEVPVEETVRLREENVRVDRRPADRAVTAADEGLLRNQTIEVTETAEEPVISKAARVVEEVVVGKDVNERAETVRDTVRRTKVDVEPIAGQDARRTTGAAGVGTTGSDQYDADFRSDYQNRYSSTGEPYENYAPAYQFGSRYANDPNYRGKSFEDTEEVMRTEYLRNNPNSTWDRAKGAVRYGWEKVSGKR